MLALQTRFQSPDIFTAVVVYARPSGLTSADRAKAKGDAKQFARVTGVVPGQVTGPVLARNGRAIETLVPVNLGSKGWDGASAAATSRRDIAQANAAGLSAHIAGPLGSAADSASSFKGIEGILLLATLVVVIVLLLVTYLSLVLWLLPVVSAGIALVSAEAFIYSTREHEEAQCCDPTGMATTAVNCQPRCGAPARQRRTPSPRRAIARCWPTAREIRPTGPPSRL